MAESAVLDEVRVSVFGSDTAIVTLEGESTVSEVVKRAASDLDVDIDISQVSLLKNGEQVTPSEPIVGGETVTASPQVANG